MNKYKTTLLFLIFISSIPEFGVLSCKMIMSYPDDMEPVKSWHNLYEKNLREGGESRLRYDKRDYIAITHEINGVERRILIDKIDPEKVDETLKKKLMDYGKPEDKATSIEEIIKYKTNNPTFVSENKNSAGLDIIGCEKFGNVIYITKYFYELEEICKMDEKNRFKKYDGRLKDMFPQCDQDWEEGSYGQVRKCSATIKKEPSFTNQAVKKISLMKFNLVELYTYLKVEETKKALRFFGCELDKQENFKSEIYYAQEVMTYDLDSQNYKDRYKTMEFNQKIDEWLRICDIVEEFHQIGLIHNDIKPTNLMHSVGPQNQLTMRLIDFGFAQPQGSYIDGQRVQLTRPFGSMLKMRYRTHEKFNDVYGIVMTIVCLHAGQGEDYFFTDAKDPNKAIDDICIEKWADKCEDLMQDAILRAMKKDFGDYDDSKKEETDPSKMNFTTLLINVFRYRIRINSAKELKAIFEKQKKAIVV